MATWLIVSSMGEPGAVRAELILQLGTALVASSSSRSFLYRATRFIHLWRDAANRRWARRMGPVISGVRCKEIPETREV